jgi:predicted AAA+ superfamily ATPase
MALIAPKRLNMAIIKRLFQEPSQSYFLFGPRGTGKSTLMRIRHKDAIWVDLLKPEVFRNYLSRPERLEEVVKGSPHRTTVVIDEVQKAPDLLSVVHSLIEEKSNIKFILTGSSARKLKKTSANLLGGRGLKRILHPFIAAELGKDFSLQNALHNGMLPLIHKSNDPQDALQAYISLYLHEEIQAEGLTRNLENFSRFLETVSFSHGALLNITNIARECGIKRKTVENYIEILEDLLLAFQLPVFSNRAQRELSVHPKFYLFDAGVFRALRPKGVLDRIEEIDGAALEGLVAQHLRAWNDYSTEKCTLSFWRTRSGVEIDFIVYGPNKFWAIEVKNSRNIYSQDTKSLETFLQDYPMAKALLLYRGNERIRQKNVLCLPCEDFLLQLKPDGDLWKE